MEWTPLADITRADANTFRDYLLNRMAPNSVLRTIGVIKAAMNHVIVENGLEQRNVFQGIKIKGAGSSNTDRLPITDEHLDLMTPAFESSEVAAALLVLLTDTGARLAEITGLEARDVDLDKAILHLRPNDHRGLKTKTSTRSIPLSHRATECLRQQQVGLSDTTPHLSRLRPTQWQRQRLRHAHEAAKDTNHRQEADNALPAPPHEGQAAQHRLS